MITTDLGAAYAPQRTLSTSRLPIKMPLAPRAPMPPVPPAPRQAPAPSRAFVRQPAPVKPPFTTPESVDVYRPTPTYSAPTYAYDTPQPPPNPAGSPTRYIADDTSASNMATATQPTTESADGSGDVTAPAGSLENAVAQATAAATPWYKNPLYWLVGGAAVVGIYIIAK